MYTHKSLKLAILAFFITTLVIFSGCDGTNHPPTIIGLTANPPSPIEVNQSTVITCLATDQDGDTLYYSWTGTGGMITGGGSTITWTAPAIAGTYTITCTVSDGTLSDVQSIIIEVLEPENQPPVITLIPDATVTLGETFTYNVEATDPEGDALTYSLTASCPAGMTIDENSGVISWTPTTIGSYGVTVEVSDGESSDIQSFSITVSEPEIVYRAFLVGVGDYIYGDDDDDLLGPPYDVDRMIQIFNQCRFGPLNTEFSTINYLKDWQATKSNILQGIASTFSAADNNDISYFYYAGHGSWWENISYICPADITSPFFVYSGISVDELENALSDIPGTKVVVLDTCHSGGFIGKGKGEITISQEELESFNDEIVNVFSQAQFKGLLTTNQYKVLTACHYYQESVGFSPVEPGDFDPFGLFTEALCDGCGYYNYDYPADTNLDTKVSLQEAYLYVKSYVQVFINLYPHFDITQDVQVYPNNSTFTIVEY